MNNKERDLFRLQHILECIDKIITLTESLQDFDTFEKKWIEQDAMIRNFEIIGEASNHISLETKDKYPDIKWHQMRGMRNFMSHEYFGVRLLTIWDTAVGDIPKLKIQISNIISEL
ncbi:MAG: DUF86 domain-containing protein [Fermentimonas sp.]|nr:DUF86 domain-containing protein [Fermentimonas sp.]